jgi:hypothetical protein
VTGGLLVGQAAGRGRRPQAGGHGVEQAEPGHLGVELGRGPPGPFQLGQLGQELPELADVRAELGGDLGRRHRRAAPAARASTRAPPPLPGSGPRPPWLTSAGLGADLLGQARLADPGLAADEDQLALAAQGAVERGPELGPLGAAADEGHLVRVLGPHGQGRQGSGQLGMGDREDVLGPGQALEGMRPDLDQGGTVRELIGHQLGGRPRQQDLAALPERP